MAASLVADYRMARLLGNEWLGRNVVWRIWR
jgi:hypothetical protein